MDEHGDEAYRKIIRLLFPDLRYGGDPDIERYFESRKAGQVGRALSIYNGALRVRYPDDPSRIELLRLYRENDPRYSAYQERLLLEFAARISARIRRNIDLITAPLEKADLSDALRALKAVESILSRLPGEAEGAGDFLYRYNEFAEALDYRRTLARRALELVREYDAVSRADSPSDYDFVARSAAIEDRRRSSPRSTASSGRAEGAYDFISRSAELEERRRKAGKQAPSYFDPARIKFSKTDRGLVEIPSALVRREDKVLAFCAKYWPRARDQAFERTVFLYSRKFGGRHFEIYRAIKSGRARGASDDEILSSVSAILTTGYSYSVSGDLYMQVMWRRLRARMEARIVAERLAVPGPESRVRARHAAYAAGSSPEEDELGALASAPPPPAGDESPTRFARRKDEHATPPAFALKETSNRARSEELDAAKAEAPRATPDKRRAAPRGESRAPRDDSVPPAEARKAVPKVAARRPVAAPERPAPRRPAKSAPKKKPLEPGFRPLVKAKGSKLLGRSPVGSEPVREIRAKRGSISDSIRKLSGKSYDVYKVIFLEKVRDDIHKTLLASQTRSHGIFDTAANDAEDQIFGFIKAHYDDPFMDWEHSAERELVQSLGFSMSSLAPVIEACFKKL
jgi:hypothetical protein